MCELTSLWQGSRDRLAPDLVPPGAAESSDAPYDVAVVGAGLTGLTTAALLARAGTRVIVLEARTAGAGTTGRSTAKVSVLQGTRMSRIHEKHPAATLRSYAEANLEGLEWLRRFAREHGVAVQVRPAFTYASTSEGENAARAELTAARAAGLPVAWDDDPGLPFATRGAVRLDEQLQVDPMDLVDALVGELARHGGALRERARVRGVSGGVRRPLVLDLADGTTVVADRVVLATGIPILDRGGFFARLQPRRSYAAALTSTWSAPGMYLSSDATTRSVRSAPSPDGELLLVGGNGHVTGRHPTPRGQLDDLLAWATRTFPSAQERYRWSAQDYGSVTELPYVGALTPGGPVLIATGYDKWGFTNAVAAAIALSKELLGERPVWSEAYRSWSLRELGALPTGISVNGQVALEMAKGYLVPALQRGSAVPGEGRGHVRYRGRRPIGVSTVGGRTRTVSAVCPHLHGVLTWNDAERSWDCPLHGSRFSASGTLLEGPATTDLEPA